MGAETKTSRKPRSLKRTPSNSNREPPWLPKQSKSLTRGLDTRARSSKGSRENWPRALLAKLRESWRTRRTYSRSFSRALPMWRVSISLHHTAYPVTDINYRNRVIESAIAVYHSPIVHFRRQFERSPTCCERARDSFPILNLSSFKFASSNRAIDCCHGSMAEPLTR